jgi:geranylgeranyl reductase family protein
MRIAIVGAGPAGAHLACLLSKNGAEVFLFDAREAWEKPCGGGVTSKALAEFPFLQTPAAAKQMVSTLRLITAQKRELTVTPSKPFAIFARAELARLMRERALDAGAQLFCERVEKTEFSNDKWNIATSARQCTVDFLVGADGANSVIRRRVGVRFTEEDFAYALGWRVTPSNGEPVTHVDVQYLGDLAGYIWLFPRTDHISYGIATSYRAAPPAQLKARLLEYLKTQDAAVAAELALAKQPSTPRAQFYAHTLPALGVARWDELRASDAAGRWALVGDAAGFVDPITGEGIYYALKSAELLAEALLAHPEEYETAWRDSFGGELRRAAELEERFYHGNFAGQPLIERMVQFAKRHRGVREVLRDLVAGEQGYVGLKARLLKSAVRFV